MCGVYGAGSSCRYGTRREACPVGRRITLPFRHPAEGLPSLSPVYPAFCLLSCPHPPTPFPTGRGRFLLSYARGFAPCIPGAGGARHWFGGRWRHPAGTCFLGRLSTLPFAYFPAPIPPPPSPAGRGRFLLFYCKGLRPLHPPGLAGRGTG